MKIGRYHIHQTTVSLLGLVLLASRASWCLGAETAGPATATAKEFQRLDEHGRPRALWGVREGTAGLFLLDKSGTIQVDVGLLSDDFPALVLHDANCLIRVKLVAGEMPALALHDNEGRTRLILWLFPDGRATVMLLAPDGTMQAQLWIGDDRASISRALHLPTNSRVAAGPISKKVHKHAGSIVKGHWTDPAQSRPRVSVAIASRRAYGAASR